MTKIDIAGLKVDAISKKELLDILRSRVSQGQKTFITTLYSEFLYASLRDRKILDMLNQADIAVADGIGIMWAARYLSIPLTVKNYWLKILQAWWQAKYTLAAIVFRPGWIKTIPMDVIPAEAGILSKDNKTSDQHQPDREGKIKWEKIVGADLIWDLAKLAADNNLSIYLLGGFGDTPELAAKNLQLNIDSGQKGYSTTGKLKIAGWSAKNPDDPTIADDLKKAAPDLLFVAYGPIRQEAWIARNMPNLPVKLAIGLGGTFDYIAGKRPNPPRFLRTTGLEWLFRLFTQPKRIKRIWQATFGLVWNLMKYKIFSSLPFRQNAVSVAINRDNEIFIARFNPEKNVLKALGYSKYKFENYWQLPQGGIEDGEDVIEGAKRELWEETAMRNVELIKISEKKYSYHWKDNSQRPLCVRKRFQYKGQEQSIIYFRFLGQEKEIVLDWDEFVEYKWVPLDRLEQEVAEEKRPLAKLVLKDLIEMREKGII